MCEQDSSGLPLPHLVRDGNNSDSDDAVKTQNNKMITRCSKCSFRTIGG